MHLVIEEPALNSEEDQQLQEQEVKSPPVPADAASSASASSSTTTPPAQHAETNHIDTTRTQTPDHIATVVRFHTVQIREFDRIVGDHPDVRNGPPLSIGWEYVQGKAIDVEEYERNKVIEKKGLRRLASGTRRDILRVKFDISLDEILEAEAEVERVKKQRTESARRSRRSFPQQPQRIARSLKQTVRRTFARGSSSSNGNNTTTSRLVIGGTKVPRGMMLFVPTFSY